MKTLEHISLVFFPYFLLLLFSLLLLPRIQWNVVYVMHCGKVECSCTRRLFSDRWEIEWQISAEAAAAAWGYKTTTPTNNSQATAPSYITLKSSIPSLSLWLTYSHAFPHAGKIIRIASHSFASFPLWLVFFSSFLFFSFRFVWNLLKRFIAKILSQHIFLRLSTLWLQIIFLWNLRRWCFVNKCVHK